jgi:phosphohistidine phosphatase
MELLLVRHAIAHERNSRRWANDAERPLSARGMVRARRAATGLKRLTAAPTRVFVSPCERTRQTATILRQCAGWPAAIVCEELRPGGSPHVLLRVLGRIKASRIALIGHEPGLSRLLATCLRGNAVSGAFEFRKMGVALVGFRDCLRPARGVLHWLLTPRVLRAARHLPLKRRSRPARLVRP